jgi:hypothetical protein
MPRWASRITLEATEDARVENLREITEVDAMEESIPKEAWRETPHPSDPYLSPYRGGFACFWDSLHKKPGERWDDNPEVVRIAFRRING